MYKNICFFGDSIGKGIVYDSYKNRYTVSEKGFVKRFADFFGINISNFSRFGCTVNKGQTLVGRHMGEIADCDLVVLEFGGNDSDHPWEDIARDPLRKYNPNTDISTFRSTYENIIAGLEEINKKIVMLSLPPIDAVRYFRWISRGKNSDNILKWLGGGVDYIYRWHEMYNNAVCDIANCAKIKLVDVRSVFLAEKNYSDFLCEDGIHPNENGHGLIFEAVRKEFCAAL